MADNYKIIMCPACGKPMKKIFLENQQFIIDVCIDGCGGIWLDNRELQKIDEETEPITELLEAYKSKVFQKTDNSAVRICPICGVKMVKNNVSAKQEIVIDECYNCGGKFFDYNELQHMRNQYKDEESRISDIKKISMDSEKMKAIFDSILFNDNVL